MFRFYYKSISRCIEYCYDNTKLQRTGLVVILEPPLLYTRSRMKVVFTTPNGQSVWSMNEVYCSLVYRCLVSCYLIRTTLFVDRVQSTSLVAKLIQETRSYCNLFPLLQNAVEEMNCNITPRMPHIHILTRILICNKSRK